MWTFLLSDVSKGHSCIMWRSKTWRRYKEEDWSSDSLQFRGVTLKEPVRGSYLTGASSQELVRQFEPVLEQAEVIKGLWESESLIARSETNIWPGQWNQWEKDPAQECDEEFKWHVRRAGFEYWRLLPTGRRRLPYDCLFGFLLLTKQWNHLL